MRKNNKIDEAAVIVPYNSRKEVLLQLRDIEPGINTWVLFGGKIEKGEKPEETLKRELKEELEWNIKNFTLFNVYLPNLTKNQERKLFVYMTPLESIKNFKIHEGFKFNFFSKEELKNIKLGFDFERILNDFYQIIKNNKGL